MQRFTRLFHEVDRTTRTSEKTLALRRYFEKAPPADAVWALRVLTGQKLIRAVPYKRLRQWAVEEAGLEPWLFNECYGAVGDLSETLSLILPGGQTPTDEPLAEMVTKRILPLAQMTEAEQKASVVATWRTLSTQQRFLFHKLISSNFRFGAAKKIVINALAAAGDVDPAVMQHRLGGRPIEPTAEAFTGLLAGTDTDSARPYPFYLAYQLNDPPEELPDLLGDSQRWRAEWKWDGIRAQIIRRGDETLVWSRGDELITEAFPELRAAGDELPDGTVLDGEVLAYENNHPLSFAMLQRRLNRKRMEPVLFADVPVVFMAYDLLEYSGEDVRDRATDERRALLEALSPETLSPALRLSPRIAFDDWPRLAELRDESRERGVEGVMLKRADACYAAGRKKGDWWKWKVDPYTVDCVMVYAQRGSGRRSSLFTDYTFAVWDGPPGQGELVPVTKAYSGLTDEEFAKVDRFIKNHTVGKKGSFRAVEPELVFEIAFEGINESSRHKSGLALRFPRMHRWRTDKKPEDADTLASLRSVLDGEVSG
ncbi:MAG: ATP-dependent DNA ligase [Planctomycetota bacterium]